MGVGGLGSGCGLSPYRRALNRLCRDLGSEHLVVFKGSFAVVLTLKQFPFAPPPPATLLLGAHVSHPISFQTQVQRAHSSERREPDPHRAARVQTRSL